jgi:hypothetical protein
VIRRGTVAAVRLRVVSMWVVLAGCQGSMSVRAVAPPAPPRPAASIVASAPVSASAGPSVPTIASASVSASASVAAVEELVTLAPKVPVCTPQQAFQFLVRKNYIPITLKKKEFQKSLEWRTKQYGFVKGFGDKSWNATKPKDHAVSVTLFGLPVTVHEKVVPALRCAEQEIKNSCASTPYVPATLSGLRSKNTYHGGEVTNHLYGIALDLDPLLNSCCNCTKKWQKSPLCAKKNVEIWERMAMPKCWVDAFEKYGFYWLGHDVLQDTMHFEFLADPDLVMQLPPSP